MTHCLPLSTQAFYPDNSCSIHGMSVCGTCIDDYGPRLEMLFDQQMYVMKNKKGHFEMPPFI